MTRTEFRASFPEMNTAPDALVDAMLTHASNAVSTEVFGDRFNEAHGYLTAHLLAISPYGKNARLQSKEGESTYGKRFEQVRAECTVGFRVI